MLKKKNQEFVFLAKKLGTNIPSLWAISNPVCTKRQGHILFFTGTTLSTNSKSPFITDLRTGLPFGQVNQEGLDNSWADFNVFISTVCFY